MGQAVEQKMVPWAIFLMRVLLAGVLIVHGFQRISDKDAKVPFAANLLQADAARVVVGSSELFVGALVFSGLFLRLALFPVVIYFAVTLVRKVAAGEPVMTANGSEAEEYLILLGLTLILAICGSGRWSLETRFTPKK